VVMLNGAPLLATTNGDSVIFSGALIVPNKNIRFWISRADLPHSAFRSDWFTGVDVPQPTAEAHNAPSVLLCAVLQM
jgi:hypothetical protein